MPVFYFFHNIGPNLAQILLQDHTHFGFQRNMLEDSNNINNFNWNPVFWKKNKKQFFLQK